MIRIADTRDAVTTLEAAKALMAEIATIECRLAVQEARHEKKVMDLKLELNQRTAEDREELSQLSQRMSVFILAHKYMFVRPRKVQTECGSFGLQDVSEVVIEDQDAFTLWAVEQDAKDCLKLVQSPIKTGIEKRLRAADPVPGCTLKEGDTAVYKVKKSLVDSEVERALT